MNISKLSQENCTGCKLCVASCPKKCIEISLDPLGFEYPVIDKTKCVDCGKCFVACPQLNKIAKKLPDFCYAVKSKDSDLLKGCSSGGVCSELASWVVKNNGVVYGATTLGTRVVYKRVDNPKDIWLLKGSKYLQSDTTIIYDHILQDLDHGVVLVIGSPCEISAIIRFTNNHSNLYTVSFPCGGWSSSKLLQEEINSKFDLQSVDRFVMRDRHNVFLDFYKGDKLISHISTYNSFFMAALDSKVSLRESCWSCDYCSHERPGDITVGDFWGLIPSDVFDSDSIRDGVSMVCTHTSKGKWLFDNVTSNLIIEEKAYEDIYLNNKRLNGPVIEDPNFNNGNRKKFIGCYEKSGLKKAVISVLREYYWSRVFRGFIHKIIDRR